MMKYRKTFGITLVVVVAVSGAAWAWGMFGGVDPAVADLQKVRDDLFSRREQMSEQERLEARDTIRGRMEGFSDDQRRQFFQSSRKLIMGFVQERLDTFFTLPPDQQQQELDKRIDKIAQRRASRDQNQAGPRDGKGGRANKTDAQRDERRKRMLDRFDPKMRAQFSEYRSRMNQRMEQRGMEPTRSPREMFGGGGRRSGPRTS